MQPGTYDFNLYQGESFARVFRVAGFDLTGYTARAALLSLPFGEAALELSCSVAVDGTEWIIAVTADPTATAALPRDFQQPVDTPRPYLWELELATASGTVLKFLRGTASVYPEATL